MAALLGELFPDVYAGVGVHSGLASGCATDLRSGLAAMRGGARPGTVPSGVPTIVFHGDQDGIVSPVNGRHVMDAAFGRDCLRQSHQEAGPDGRTFTRHAYGGAGALSARGEHWVLHGADHRWSGGHADGSYADPRGPDASEEMLRFFKALPVAARASVRS